MGWQIRRSKGFGPFRLTATKSGLSLSTGIPGLRVGVNTRGQVRRTFRIPGTGIYNTKLLNPKGRSSGQPRGRQRAVDGGLAAIANNATGSFRLEVVDATGGWRQVTEGEPGLVTAQVVYVRQHPEDIAAVAGIGPDSFGRCRGLRDALLVVDGDTWDVNLLVHRDENPSLFGRSKDDAAQSVTLGRLAKRDADKWSAQFAGRPIRVAVLIDATPGLDHPVTVLFKPAMLADDYTEPGKQQAPAVHPSPAAPAPTPTAPNPVAASTATAPATPEPGWYPDPAKQATYRWWDGAQWTASTA